MGGDTQLKKHVEDELSWQPSVDEASIGVSVKDAIVTLTGHVRTYAEKMAAERAVMRIQGVKALASELQVSLPGLMNAPMRISRRPLSMYWSGTRWSPRMQSR